MTNKEFVELLRQIAARVRALKTVQEALALAADLIEIAATRVETDNKLSATKNGR